MKFAVVLGIGGALFLHGAFLAFGGLLLPEARPDHGTTREVELVADVEDEKPTEPEPPPEEELQEEPPPAPEERPPDAVSLARDPSVVGEDGPALDAASLSAISAALEGSSGGGDFTQSLSFDSGGRLGASGREVGGDPLEAAFSLAEIDQKPRPIFQASPLYPAEARAKRLEGVVTLIYVVDENGKVQNPRVEKSTFPAFEAPALEALRQWKFEPAVRGGQRVSCRMRGSIRFQPN